MVNFTEAPRLMSVAYITVLPIPESTGTQVSSARPPTLRRFDWFAYTDQQSSQCEISDQGAEFEIYRET